MEAPFRRIRQGGFILLLGGRKGVCGEGGRLPNADEKTGASERARLQTLAKETYPPSVEERQRLVEEARRVDLERRSRRK